MAYEFQEIEKKWQKYWDDNKTFKTDVWDFSKPKYYALDMFPYPSGQGLHVGHPEGYTATDIMSRYKRMRGYNVLHPMGWDAFGLPAEQYAINTGNHPDIFTKNNIETFKRQLKMLGFSFDWDKEISTCDPSYYKWTQWIFKQLYNDGLAKLVDMPVNWCEELGTVLANDEVIDGKSERGGFPVVRKNMKQWVLDIPKYAERLLEGLENIDWPESTKEIQRNWIGKSVGAHVKFKISKHDLDFTVFTTRADTLFGATYCVLAPEHEYIDTITTNDCKEAVEAYKKQCASKSDLERTELNKEKTGVFTGAYAINPVNGKEIPIWISDYVLITYGTGAIMAVPAHDDRDFEFAEKFKLPVLSVIMEKSDDEKIQLQNELEARLIYEYWSEGKRIPGMKKAFTDVENGIAVNSDFLNGLSSKEAIEKAIEYIEENQLGQRKVNYKLRDWVFSRQRYWGEPIPMVYCEKCGWNPIVEEELPLKLPEIEDYEPSENGESPLAKQLDWIKTKCPCCQGEATRETDTMPQWAGSSWYFLRYMDAHNNDALASEEAINYWGPVDWYNGGMEHTTLHLLYSRFWHKFLYDIGVVPTKEPYQKRTSHGMILGTNGEKMSKSKGNVVNPDDIVEEFGADTFRVYEMFMGPFDQTAPWSMESIRGCGKFLDRVWNMQEMLVEGDEYSTKHQKMMHKAIKKVTSDIEEMKFNTAVATFMTMVNEFYKDKEINKAEYKTFLHLLNPFAPHMTEELFQILGETKTINETEWPKYDEAKTIDDEIEIPVQINGKVKDVVKVPKDSEESDVKEVVKASELVQKAIDGKNIIKEIYVKGKIYNIVVK